MHSAACSIHIPIVVRSRTSAAKLMPTLPDYMRVNFNFNGTLMDSAHAGRYCVEIEKYPQVAMYETPIPQSDVTGNKQGVQARESGWIHGCRTAALTGGTICRIIDSYSGTVTAVHPQRFRPRRRTGPVCARCRGLL
jgi:hypothetical protein